VIRESLLEVPANAETEKKVSVVYATDYLNKLTGEKIERECKQRLRDGCKTLVLNFRQTELVNSIGVSILLGVIDAAANAGAKVVFSDLNQNTVELFDMLGLTRHVELAENSN
jgi:anti-anti-sigma factor